MKKIILFILFITVAAAANASFVSENGKLRVEGLQLVNECGNPIQLRGVSTHGLQWFWDCYQYDAPPDFAVNYMGANLFRIAMYVDEGAAYLSNPPLFTSRVNQLVDKMENRGIYTIIDWHIIGDPMELIDYAKVFWEDMSAEHAGKDHVIYEIFNEPTGVSWDVIRNYAHEIIPIIRANDPDTLIIVGTPNWSQLGSDVAANPITITSNIMYACHFYADSQWHQPTMITNYINSIPIFVSEWGATDSSGDGTVNTIEAQAFIDVMNGNNTAGVTLSWASWSFSDDTRSSSMLLTGTCGMADITGARLSESGNFIMEKIAETPVNVDPCWSPTPTYTVTLTSTDTPVLTQTTTWTVTETHTVSPTFTISTTHTISPTATPTSTISKTHTITKTHTVSPTATITPTFAPARINCGSYSGYTDTQGNYWEADVYFNGGSRSTSTGVISGTNDDTLYRSERWGDFTYNIPVPPGLYRVTLKFAEIYWDEAGERVFSVTAEGNAVITGLDLIAQAGQNAAVDRTFEIAVSDGVLNLSFTASVDSAKAAAIQVLEVNTSPTPTPTGTPLYKSDYNEMYVYPSLLDVRKGKTKICFKNLTHYTELSIFNLYGELVYRTEGDTHRGELCYDLKNKRMQDRLAPGIYVYVLQSGGLVKKGKFVIIR